MLAVHSSNTKQVPTLDKWIYLFILLHVVLWTLSPTLIRHTLPMDAIEGAIWGNQLQWGYDKNPFINGWLTSLAVFMGGGSSWIIYFFSQLSVALCFWAIWQLGKQILPTASAIIGMLILAALQYYNLHAIDFNDNTLELGFWSATVLFYYLALRHDKLHYWLLTGCFAGLSMMTKYYSALLLISMLLFLLCNSNTRQYWAKPNLYLGLGLLLVIALPHTIWLFYHNFVTINYALRRVSGESSWLNHFVYPVKFAWQQFCVFFPGLILLCGLTIGKKSKSKAESISSFDKKFLLIVGMGPFLLTLIIALIGGIKLHAGWGQPLLSMWGLIFLAYFSPKLTSTRLKFFGAGLVTIILGMNLSYCIALIKAQKPSSANFPGQVIATTLEKEWHNIYMNDLAYVVGPRWLAGNIAFYSKDHPKVYMEANAEFCPWIDEAELKKHGAIFVWDQTERYQQSYDDLRKRFPNLSAKRYLFFAWLRNKKMAPVEIGLAFLPPEEKVKRTSEDAG